MPLSRHRQAATLARWLGPWTDSERCPGGIAREALTLEGSPGDGQPAASASASSGHGLTCYRYQPSAGAVTGVYVVVPGLHYQGPEDPRLDRFCRVLASAGLMVLAPMLPSYLALRVLPTAATDLALVCEHAIARATELSLPRPALFSISFGSIPAFEVAASERFRDKLGALVVFGGLCDFRATIRFAVSGRAFYRGKAVAAPHDVSNAPAVFINVLDHIDVEGPREPLREAWLELARRTWGRPALRPAPQRQRIADDITPKLPPGQRELFLIGCGLRPGGEALLEAGLVAAGDAFDFTDPLPHIKRLKAPVVVAHGRDDDVIAWPEALKLRDALQGHPDHRTYLTGMYGHSGSALPSLGQVVDELRTMKETLYAFVDAPHEALASSRHAQRQAP